MLNDTQLDDVKSKLEAGTPLRDIVSNDYGDEHAGEVRKQLVDKFTLEIIRPLIVSANLTSLTVEQLNDRISTVQSNLTRLIDIRDAKL
jgi:hypothetical protein